MKIAIVGAGVAGLCTAKTLDRFGHEVVIFDKAPDVGGVWSRTRRYPGLCTQSPRDTYAFSDYPMPKGYPEWPSGEQVQAYLAGYATHFGLEEKLRLSSEVLAARPRPGGWTLSVRHVGTGEEESLGFDHLIVANGVFCEPAPPAFEGTQDFEAAGGRVLNGTDVHDEEVARGRHVLIVGYGKSACDIAAAISPLASSTDVVARQLLWKVPRLVGGKVNFKLLLLTRLGEALFPYRNQKGLERFLHGPGDPIRRRMLSSVGSIATRQFRLEQLNLVPPGQFSDIVKGAIGLASEGFFEGVDNGTISVDANTTIKRLLEKDGSPYAELADGRLLRADLVICATGFRQDVPFLPVEMQQKLRDGRGNFLLYRHIQPVGVEHLSFAGYNSSFFSQLSAEMAAAWIAAQLSGTFEPPDEADMLKEIEAQLDFLDSALNGHHCHGTKVIPYSLHNIDEILGDLDLNIPRRSRAKQWLAPINPKDYRHVVEKLESRLG